ncbi:MAG: hypothetical protein COX80_03115 [Candidatus Magasanikbacteria bacterium CG_4_10_14_0_2_um_filter_33_14]|uniref:Transcription regulator TrmB N-terminal domain-containing protein n=1 Tax=Candidatus Magasanikbacteria bacterium CG_4_10_14_0_2_um_filter_33_14 TaxID=1974636 RepID=A0A2M7VAC3_9BACT|nr:MAG: hypothetical protein COX80_03115 [Candidatus Magasanikbacteria bacterium CG_4_10_14_0_2_um_filter_33_14]
MFHWNQLLTNLGLSENESLLYLTSLENGQKTVQELSTLTKLSRVTIYALIDSLKNQGLITSVEKGKKTLFAAEPPQRLLNFGEQRLQDLKATVSEMKAGLDELDLKARGEKPVVKLFEGDESLKALAEDIVHSKPKEIYEFEDLEAFRKIPIGDVVLNDLYGKLIKMKINRKLVYGTSTRPPKKFSNYEQVYSFKLDGELKGSILAYNNKLALSVYKDKQMVVLIESPELVQTFKKLLDLLIDKKTNIKEIKEVSKE